MLQKISLIALFLGVFHFGFGQLTKTDVEYELAKYTRKNCYRFSISHITTIKELDEMVADNFEIKFADNLLTILNGEHYFAIPYNSISMIQSSSSVKKDGKFVIYIH